MSVTVGVSDIVIAIRDKLRGPPGKLPWRKRFLVTNKMLAIVRKDDRRLRRLGESRIDNREEVRADHRRIRQAEIVSTIEEEAMRQEGLQLEEEDENALAERIRLIKGRLLQRDQKRRFPRRGASPGRGTSLGRGGGGRRIGGGGGI
ncbi:hypothetical protein Fmac_000389 [Flemingia macrophylla]|uniref:Uncharacterized protein n=1 Tax=Flemingia macrophylla TaxID=520843 RepID=A0ABD1NE51_9FABA